MQVWGATQLTLPDPCDRDRDRDPPAMLRLLKQCGTPEGVKIDTTHDHETLDSDSCTCNASPDSSTPITSKKLSI